MPLNELGDINDPMPKENVAARLACFITNLDGFDVPSGVHSHMKLRKTFSGGAEGK